MTMTDPAQKPYLSPQEYAKHAGVHINTVYRFISTNRLPAAFRFGRLWKIPPDAIPIDIGATPKKPSPDTGIKADRDAAEAAKAKTARLSAERELAILQEKVLTDEQIKVKETELLQREDAIIRDRVLLDDRERQLNEREEQMVAEKQRLPVTAADGAVKQLQAREQALEQKTKKVNAQQEAREADIKQREEALDAKEASVKKHEAEWTRNKQGLAADINFLIHVVGVLRNGNGKEKKEILREVPAHHWLTIKVTD